MGDKLFFSSSVLSLQVFFLFKRAPARRGERRLDTAETRNDMEITAGAM
jgi:hypothetical protein